jgi:methionine sulfoxide reductase heme-binding subunit
MQRVARHAVLFLASIAVGVLFHFGLRSTSTFYTISMATAYGSMVLLALSLMIGPWNKLRGRPNPVSGYLRRDIGIWAGILGLAHVIAGFQLHMPRWWNYFLPPETLRISQWVTFGLANYVGLGSTLILLLLLCISNDASLRALGAGRWKSLQRWNYAGALLAIAHGVLYQVIEKRSFAFIAAFAAIILAAMAMQYAGFREVTKKSGA